MAYFDYSDFGLTNRPFTDLFQDIGDPARQVSWLAGHRLLGVSDLLLERGLIEPSMAAMIRPLANKRARVPAAQMAEERKVLCELMQAEVPALPLKGCLLGYRVYPKSDQRLRCDLDVIVAKNTVNDAQGVLRELGYQPKWRVTGGTPSTQQTWQRRSPQRWFQVDLHWALRNHPALRDCLGFEEQWAAAVEVDVLDRRVKGQGNVHALLNASMHWFDDLFPVERPLGWLLDKDLLWRAMSDNEREYAVSLAVERGVAGLLAESLGMTRMVFGAPVSDDVLVKLENAGRRQRATRLTRTDRHPVLKWLFTIRCEPGLQGKFGRIRESLLPSPEHMRERYPAGSRLGLPGLYWKRLVKDWNNGI